MKYFLLLPLCLLLNLLSAQSLIKNINPASDAFPANGIAIDGVYYFTADDGSHGTELWKSDGTAAGTIMVADINTSGSAAPLHLTEVNGGLYFTADDGTHGRELWYLDIQGNIAPAMVDDILVGSAGSDPENLASFSNELFFSANDGNIGRELYNAPPGGSSQLISDINSGAGDSSPANLTADASILYFTADNGADGIELWKSDGTPGGTIIVDDINSTGNSTPTQLTLALDKVYFSANDGTANYLYYSDGNTTDKVRGGFFGNLTFQNPNHLTTSGGNLFFVTSSYVLQKVSTIGLQQVAGFTSAQNPNNFTDVNGLLFFSVSSGGFTDNELWLTDGTSSLTYMVKSFSDYITNLTALNGVLFFNANDPTNGRELWISNGVGYTTVMVNDLNSGNNSSDPDNMQVVNDSLFFSANDGTNGRELWKYNLPCSQDYSPVNFGAGLHTASNSNTDANGWTNYCDSDGKLLLSLQLGSSGAVISNNGVSINVGEPTYVYYQQNCGTSNNCFITNPDGAAMYNTSWDVQPTTQPTSDVGVRFYLPVDMVHDLNEVLTNNGKSGVPAHEDLRFYKITNSSLAAHTSLVNVTSSDVIELTNGTPSTTQWSYGTKRDLIEYYAEMKVSSFSGGGGGGGAGGGSFLPVELIHFRANALSKAIQLDWSTATEVNSSHFEIQKSADGTNWSTIQSLNAQGNSIEPINYKYVDHQPFTGINYYRLHIVDLDGYSEFSNIKSAEMGSANSSFRLSPNPAGNEVSIFSTEVMHPNTPTNIRILNSVGKLMQQFNFQPGQKNTIQTNNWIPGIYYIEVQTGSVKQIERLLKL